MATTRQALTRGRRFVQRRTRFAAVLAALAAFAIPAAWASDRFADVPDSNPHHDNINTIARAGITQGCSPTLFCPANSVMRQGMATFLARTLRALTPALRPGASHGGAVDPDANPIVCATQELSPAVDATAIIQGFVNLKQADAGELGYQVILAEGDGTTWIDLPFQFRGSATTFASGAWSTAQIMTFVPHIPANSPSRYALRVTRESGTADASNHHCRIWVTLNYADAGPPMLDD